jgi:periplasmic copper chaperone A
MTRHLRNALLAALSLLALAVPATAYAHVTVQPSTGPSGGLARLDVLVPNERSDAGTVKVDVQMPPGVISASYAPAPGWSVKVARDKLDQPIQTEDGFQVDEQISQITWTGHGPQGVIPPGAFQQFGLSVKLPSGQPGDVVTFKALQTYDDGEVVRWIGPEGSDNPSPAVTLTAAAAEEGHGAPSSSARSEQTAATAPASTAAESSGGGSDTLAIVALAVGGLGLAAGIAGLVAARRTRERASA